jgi:hypothetical protein
MYKKEGMGLEARENRPESGWLVFFPEQATI